MSRYAVYGEEPLVPPVGYQGDFSPWHVPGLLEAVPPSTYPSSASSYAELPFLFGVQDPAIIPVVNGQGNRRRSGRNSDHVKHRRTRSGCYTCRSRRVKCDEAKPTCERCRKGNRECAYPDVTSPQKTNVDAKESASLDTTTDLQASSDDEDVEEGQGLSTIPDEDEEELAHQSSPMPPTSWRQPFTRHNSSEASSINHDTERSPTTSAETSRQHSICEVTDNSARQPMKHEPPHDKIDLSHLPHDLRFYLSFYLREITYHHYSLKHDSCNFLACLVQVALSNEALLNAIVGFAAYQHSLQAPRAKIQDFLMYYNKSVSLLLRSLRKDQSRTLGNLLTMLQLACIEEYLGDWVNLFGHQKAAHEILTQLYTPETITESVFTRVVLRWYARFDVFAGLMAGSTTVLSKEWFVIHQRWLRKQLEVAPNNIDLMYEEVICAHRLASMALSSLFCQVKMNEIPFETFMAQNEEIGNLLTHWKDNLNPALLDPKWLVKDYTGAPPRDPNDIVDPYIPNSLYYGPLWPTNQVLLDVHGTLLMQKMNTSLILQNEASRDLAMNAFACCQIFESIEYWPGSPKGSLMACQAGLGIAALFLPQDRTHHMWLRRKFAIIEAQGYIYPNTFKTRMSELFQDPSCMHWWLPNDESYPRIIKMIKKFIEQRASQARDAPTQDLQDMKALFAALRVEESESPTP